MWVRNSRPFAPLLALWTSACPQAVPDSQQFGASDASFTAGDLPRLGDATASDTPGVDHAPADQGQETAAVADSAPDTAIVPDIAVQPDDGAAIPTDLGPCGCVSDTECSGVALGTCQKATCQKKCQCVVVAAPDGTACGSDKICQGGNCLPAPPKGPWAKAIAAGGDTSCAIRLDGTAACWGDNGQGQLGIGIQSKDYVETVPQAVIALTAVAEVALGNSHACARHGGGKVSCWGDGFNGKIGNGEGSGKALAPAAVKGLTDALAIAAGAETSFAVRNGATLWGWGSGTGDPFATGKYTASPVPVQVQGGVLGVQKACAGYYHTCALSLDAGKVTCWGRNPDGQIGNGQIGDNSSAVPPTVVAGLPAVVDLACGHYHTCAWDAAGKAWCWGKNLSSQLGQGGYSNGIASPVAVKDLVDVKQVSAGQGHTCAVKTTGLVACWGDNDEGEAGQPNMGKDVDLPAAVALPGKAKAVACGLDHSCALLDDGSVYCWGDGSDGQLGNGGKVDSAAPVAVAGSVPK